MVLSYVSCSESSRTAFFGVNVLILAASLFCLLSCALVIVYTYSNPRVPENDVKQFLKARLEVGTFVIAIILSLVWLESLQLHSIGDLSLLEGAKYCSSSIDAV